MIFSNGRQQARVLFSCRVIQESLVDAFNNIFDKIEIGMTNPTASYGTVAPAIMSSNVPNMAAAVHLDTSSWSSQLRFLI